MNSVISKGCLGSDPQLLPNAGYQEILPLCNISCGRGIHGTGLPVYEEQLETHQK